MTDEPAAEPHPRRRWSDDHPFAACGRCLLQVVQATVALALRTLFRRG